ncbi:MAG: hypothetical protein ACLPJH_03580 [Myxococcaceae bacterium]
MSIQKKLLWAAVVVLGAVSFGILRHASKFGNAAASNQVLAPAKSIADMHRIIFDDYLDATLAALSVAIVVTMVVYAFFDIRKALRTSKETAIEVGGVSGAAAGAVGV